MQVCFLKKYCHQYSDEYEIFLLGLAIELGFFSPVIASATNQSLHRKVLSELV